MEINLKYMFVPSKYEDEVVTNAIMAFKKEETRIDVIRAKYGKDAKIVHCKQWYYVLPSDVFENLYNKIHTFKLGD